MAFVKADPTPTAPPLPGGWVGWSPALQLAGCQPAAFLTSRHKVLFFFTCIFSQKKEAHEWDGDGKNAGFGAADAGVMIFLNEISQQCFEQPKSTPPPPSSDR